MDRSIEVVLQCEAFPGLEFEGRRPVFVGLQKKKAIVEATPGDAESATFIIPVRLKEGRAGRPDFGGPFVHGKPGDRFLYLVWFQNGPQPERFRRAKIKLSHLDWAALAGEQVTARLQLSDRRGQPIAATVDESLIAWQI